MKVSQLEFDFTTPFPSASNARQRADWRIGHLSRRYRLPATHAAIYAAEMHMPVEEIH